MDMQHASCVDALPGKSSIFKMIHVNEPWDNISYNISWPNVDTHPWRRKLVSTSLSRTSTLMALSENKGQPKSWWLIIIFPIKHHHDWGRHIPLSDTPKHHIVGSISHVIPFPNVLCTGDYVGHINICMYNMYTCICIYIYTMRVM